MKTRNIIFFLIGLLTFSSCQDMFTPAEENTKQLEAMVQETNYVYGLLMYGYNRLPYVTTTQTDVATDDAVTNVKGETYREMATGSWRADNNPMSRWDACKDGVQYVNLFLTIVDKVKWAPSAQSKQQMFIDRLTGEALGLRAIFYYHLLQAHAGYVDGDDQLYGVPLLTEPEDGSSDYNQPRASFADCVKQIFADCDAAAALLPDQYQDIDDVENITKNKQKYKDLGVQLAGYNLVFGNKAKNLVSGKIAQAIKAQTALLAASPAFRDKSGVSSEDAAKICAEVLKNVEFDENGNHWYNDAEKLSSSSSNMPEILWRGDWVNADASQESNNFPPSLFGSGMVNPTQNLVDAFPMKDGKPWKNADGSYHPDYDPQDPYANRDPRLADDVICNNTKFKSVVIVTGNYPTTTDKKGNVDNINNSPTSTRTGYYLKKLLRDDAGPTAASSRAITQAHIFPRIRYTEMYLAYAETANEAWGPNSDGGTGVGTAKEIIQKIRQRGGIGKDENGVYQGDPYLDECANDKAKMRELIRNERRIELCFENKRFWDLRRWQLPINESAKGVQIDKIDETKDATPDNLKYTYIEVEERKYEDYQNYGPLPYNEVLNWSNLKQNKGW